MCQSVSPRQSPLHNVQVWYLPRLLIDGRGQAYLCVAPRVYIGAQQLVALGAEKHPLIVQPRLCWYATSASLRANASSKVSYRSKHLVIAFDVPFLAHLLGAGGWRGAAKR